MVEVCDDLSVRGIPEVGVGHCVPFDPRPASAIAEAVELSKGEGICEGGGVSVVGARECKDPGGQFGPLGVQGYCELVVGVKLVVPDRGGCGVKHFGVVGGLVAEHPSEESPVACSESVLVCGGE